MKFSQVQKDVYSVFGSPEWENEDILMYPSNFIPKSEVTEFCRVTILPARPQYLFGSSEQVSGLIIVDIFTPSGQGSSRLHEIADILDTHLAYVSINSTQLGNSSLSVFGRDKDNPNLFRGTYSIPFFFYGV